MDNFQDDLLLIKVQLRGFSVNKDVLKTNMLEGTIIPHRRVYDGVRLVLNGNLEEISNFKTDKQMLQFRSRARSKHSEFLKEKKIETEKSSTDIQRDTLKKSLGNEKSLLARLTKSHDTLLKKADALAVEAELKKKFSLISESNETRKRSLEAKDVCDQTSSKIWKLENEIKQLK